MGRIRGTHPDDSAVEVGTDRRLAAHLVGVTAHSTPATTAPIGPLLEMFAVTEIDRQLVSKNQPLLRYFRDRGRPVLLRDRLGTDFIAKSFFRPHLNPCPSATA